MRKTLWSPLVIGMLILIPNLICYANGPGTTTASFLKIGVGARAASMGEAFTALASDGTSLYWNPAGLTGLKTKEILATYNSWFEEIGHGYLSLTFPTGRGVMGLGVNYVDMGKLEGRDVEGSPTGDFTASDTHLLLGYAKKLKKSSWGLTVGWLQDRIKNDTRSAFLGNIGLLYPLGKRLTLGAVAQNVGSQLGNDPLPLTLKIGIASSRGTLTLAADLAKPRDNDLYWCVGAEWWIREIVALRAGHKTNQDVGQGWSAGLGFKLRKSHLDYAYVPYGDLGNTHRISLRIRF